LVKLTDPLAFLSLHADKLIILDEIQRAPDLFRVLRGLIDQNRRAGRKDGQFLVLGSASLELLRQSSESLAGRIAYIELGGLNVLVAPADEPGDLHRLWLRGGFPESYLAASDALAQEWLENLIRTYLERDIPQLGFRIPATRLRRLWTMLGHLQGEGVNFSKLGGNLEVDGKTVAGYLDLPGRPAAGAPPRALARQRQKASGQIAALLCSRQRHPASALGHSQPRQTVVESGAGQELGGIRHREHPIGPAERNRDLLLPHCRRRRNRPSNGSLTKRSTSLV